jgi:phosphoglycolate phosphatase
MKWITLDRMMGLPDSLVFDLDGTLWDTCEACARGWNNVVHRNGIAFRTIVADDVRRVAGKPHDECMRDTFVGLSEAELRVLTEETIAEDNRIVEEEGGVLFAGVREGLLALSERYPLFVVSNCQSGYIELFLKHSGVGTVIRDFECWGNTGRAKPENLRRVIERNDLKAPWFVGDTNGDREAALACNAPFVYAAYGFGRCDGWALRIGSFGDLIGALL